MKLGPNQQKWVDDLRSKTYSQGGGRLVRDGNYCCLGVACETLEVKKIEIEKEVFYGVSKSRFYAPPEVVDLIKLLDDVGTLTRPVTITTEAGRERQVFTLSELNDNGWTFEQIADLIEEYPEMVFYGSK